MPRVERSTFQSDGPVLGRNGPQGHGDEQDDEDDGHRNAPETVDRKSGVFDTCDTKSMTWRSRSMSAALAVCSAV